MNLAWLHLRRRWRSREAEQPAVRALLMQALPSARAPLGTVRLLALDIETTGLNPAHDRVLSAGWLPVEHGAIQLAGACEQQLRPQREIGASATIHGLRDVDLAQGGDEPTLLDAMLPALTGRVLLAHGAAIEMGFLDRMLRRAYGLPLLVPRVCTLTLEAQLRSGLGEPAREGELTLAACRRRYGLPDAREHDALADALACAELFLAQVETMGGMDRLRLSAVLV